MHLDGEAIKRFRADKGFTQAILAKKTGYDSRTIQRAEAGEPVLNTVAAEMAQALDVRVDQIKSRQGDLLEYNSDPAQGLVTLVECSSGRTLFKQLRDTAFLTVERDFDPRPEHRDTVRSFGAFIDKTWITPWAEWFERTDILNISEEQSFELMIQAGETITQLNSLGLRVMTGAYQTLHDTIRYGDEGTHVNLANPKPIEYQCLIVCVTDRSDGSLRRFPDDHIDKIIGF